MTKLGLENINIFKEDITSRFRYNGKTSVKTCFGAVCTGLYILVMLAFTVYYAMPVLDKDNPKVKTVSLSTSEDKELKYSEYGPIYFSIETINGHSVYNRSMINAYIMQAGINESGLYKNTFQFRECKGNPF